MLSVPFSGEQRFGCRVPGLWRMNARDFDDADVSSRSILRSSQPCFPEILECDGHANATRRCSRDKFVLFDIMWLAVILGWNFPSNPEANYSVNVLAECFPADRNPHTLWVGVCEPTLDSRSTPGLSECVDNFDQPTDVDLDSGPGSSWTVPKLQLSSDEARLLSVWTPVLLLCWKRKWIFISSFLPEAFEPSLTGIWKVMETPGYHWGTTCPGAAATSTLHYTSAAREQSCLHQTKMVELRWSTGAPAEHKTFSKTYLEDFLHMVGFALVLPKPSSFRAALGLFWKPNDPQTSGFLQFWSSLPCMVTVVSHSLHLVRTFSRPWISLEFEEMNLLCILHWQALSCSLTREQTACDMNVEGKKICFYSAHLPCRTMT